MNQIIAPLDNISSEQLASLRGVFFDLDDTFTTHGKIPACSFQALWALKHADVVAIAVTGRPAGWCDHIARMWPVDGVVGENGAFYFWFDEEERRLKKRFLDTDSDRAQKRQRLMIIRDEILAAVPGCRVASDQNYREADLAIVMLVGCPEPEVAATGVDVISVGWLTHSAPVLDVGLDLEGPTRIGPVG